MHGKKKSAADIAGDWDGVLEKDEARNLGKDYIWEVPIWPPKYKKSRFFNPLIYQGSLEVISS